MGQSIYYQTLFAALAVLPGFALGNEFKKFGHDVIIDFQYKAPAVDHRSWAMKRTGVNGKSVDTEGPDKVGAIQFSSVGDAASFDWSRDTECFWTRECYVYLSEYPGVDRLVWNIAEARVTEQDGLLARAVHVECAALVLLADAPETCKI